jgi:hypothetical protein
MTELIALSVPPNGQFLDEVWDETAMNDVQREADPAQPLIAVVLCCSVLAWVPQLAATALLAGVIARSSS